MKVAFPPLPRRPGLDPGPRVCSYGIGIEAPGQARSGTGMGIGATLTRWLPALLLVLALPAMAQERSPSNCIALSQNDLGPEVVQLAALPVPPPADTLRIWYLDHASFLLQTAGGMIAVTDYTGHTGKADTVPDVVTMNNYHDTHWTAFPDPRIGHVLEGWPKGGLPARHELDLGQMLVRNVTTDTRGPFGEGAQKDGNSIFIFEAAGLCIGHLGHLHQNLSPAQIASIGRLDVVMVPVDGTYTMNRAAMAGIVRQLHARIIIPMHWFSPEMLGQFVGLLQQDFAVDLRDGPELLVSADSLPERPTVVVLTPRWLD